MCRFGWAPLLFVLHDGQTERALMLGTPRNPPRGGDPGPVPVLGAAGASSSASASGWIDPHPCAPPMMPTLVPPGLRTTAWVVPSGLYSIRPSMCPPCRSIFTRHVCTSSTLKTSIVGGAGLAASELATDAAAADLVAIRVPPAAAIPAVGWSLRSRLPSPESRRISVSSFFR